MEVAILAEVEEEDLVEAVESRLGDHLLSDLFLVLAADLGDLALVELTQAPKSLGTVEEPLSEVREQRRRLVARDDLNGVEHVGAEIVLDAVEVIEEDLEQALVGNDFFSEGTAEMSFLDTAPLPDLIEELVLGGGRRVDHRLQAEKRRSRGLAGIEQKERRRVLEVLAARIVDELLLSLLVLAIVVEHVVALELTESNRGISN